MSEENKPRLVQRINMILAGWNVFILAGFLTLWALISSANAVFGGFYLYSIQFWVYSAVALVAGIFAGIWGARRLHAYFHSMGTVGSYIWLVILAYLSVTTAVSQFAYNVK